jgi:hypothetical protein
MNQSIHLPEVERLERAVQELSRLVVDLAQKVSPAKMWYSRAELASLKDIPVSAFYNKPWLLPGKPSKQNGNDRWSFKQVWDSGWIWKSDKDLSPKEGKGDGTETGIAAGNVQPPAPVQRVRRQRQGAHTG